MKSGRVYVCHTWYHAHLACVKELLLKREGEQEPADLVLSTMSNDFGDLPSRLEGRNIFRQVFLFDEQAGTDRPEIAALHRDRGNLFANLMQRIRYTKALGDLQEAYVPVDFAAYAHVYVFCDSDPIGYYLNRKRIPYHALEDGLNSGKLDNQARLSNEGAWPLKRLLARMGLIFIECGYSRYCLDYEVNDRAQNFDPPANCIEVPRRGLYDRLTPEDHALLAEIFLPDAAALNEQMQALQRAGRPVAMILTEPLCAMPVREQIFRDVVERYIDDHAVIIKPHPRDTLDYAGIFPPDYPDLSVLQGHFPMEALDDLASFRIDVLVSVITQVDDARFAKSVDYLGLDFLDAYEEPAVHRKMNRLTGRDRDMVVFHAPAEMPETAGQVTLRPAKPADEAWWLALRNEPSVRASARDTHEILPEAHHRWFTAALSDADERLYVVLKGDTPAGQLRLTRRAVSGGVEISYAVGEAFRGEGVGTELLRHAVRLSKEEFPGLPLYGEVKADNEASLHTFAKAGYIR